jgi:hypothetical protein
MTAFDTITYKEIAYPYGILMPLNVHIIQDVMNYLHDIGLNIVLDYTWEIRDDINDQTRKCRMGFKIPLPSGIETEFRLKFT